MAHSQFAGRFPKPGAAGGEESPQPSPFAEPFEAITTSPATPLSFVVGVTDVAILRSNFMASHCVAEAGSPHEVILVLGGPNVTAKLRRGLQQAQHEWVVCIHQDVWLPPGWDCQLVQQLQEAERRFGPVGVAGVYGVGEVIVPGDSTHSMSAERIGWVIDRGRTLKDGPELPARISTLDELLFVVRRDTPLKLDPALGNHFYGVDLCMQAQELGLATVALGALCHHNSRHIGLGEGFHDSAAAFARKWSHRLPIATPCVIVDRDGSVHLLGNAMPGPRSIAYVLEEKTNAIRSTDRSTPVGEGRH